MTAVDIHILRLAAGYALLLIPFVILMWYRVPLLGRLTVALVRMTVQLIFVGLYLQVVFELNNPWLNLLWLAVMISVADLSILRGCDLRLMRLWLPAFIALLAGTTVPLLYFLYVILSHAGLMHAQYVIPIGGMILGNCLRADIIGLRSFYQSIRKDEKPFQYSLAQGARFAEATRPYLVDSLHAALSPTIATMTTIGLVSLPGMMTGVILAGSNPLTAIKYQIAIMISIFTGTAITILLVICLSMRASFTPYGTLDKAIFRS